MTEILNETIRLLPGQEKTNVIVPFALHKKYEALFLHCAYSPKTVADEALCQRLISRAITEQVPQKERAGLDWRYYLPLKNLVTPSLDYEESYIGCAHRQDDDMFLTVSANGSSPGFLAHPVGAGRWRVVLNLHAVMVPVTYRLTVTAKEAK